MSRLQPTVLCLSGFDPSGGAGIQADIESIASMGAHAVPVITALTVQNTQDVVDFQVVDEPFFSRQLSTLLDDIAVQAIKIGMIGSPSITESIGQLLQQFPELPVVYDPVLSSGSGTDLTKSPMLASIRENILPYTTILTPNSLEARLLAQAEELTDCGQELMKLGCTSVLITGTHESNEHVDNLWFDQGEYVETFSWDRLPNEYHGSGCTLASAIAALVAQGLDGFNAVNEAQDYSWNALKHAFKISEHGQLIPHRFYWQQPDE